MKTVKANSGAFWGCANDLLPEQIWSNSVKTRRVAWADLWPAFGLHRPIINLIQDTLISIFFWLVYRLSCIRNDSRAGGADYHSLHFRFHLIYCMCSGTTCPWKEKASYHVDTFVNMAQAITPTLDKNRPLENGIFRKFWKIFGL